MSKKNIGLAVGVVLIVVGLLLFVPTEEAGGAGSGASGGTADESDETRPFLWHGVVVLVVGAIVAAVSWMKGDEWDAT